MPQNGAPWGIRTLDVLIRSQSLYPAEVTAHLNAAKAIIVVSTMNVNSRSERNAKKNG